MKKWFGILDEGAREDLLFHSREMAQSLACIELNMFKGKKFIQLLHDVVRDAEGVTDEGEEDRMMQMNAITGAQQNILLVSTLYLSNDLSQIKERLTRTLGSHLREWQGTSNKTLRGVDDSLGWLQKQTHGGQFLQMCAKILGELECWKTLRYIGFEEGQDVLGMLPEDVYGIINYEQEIADYVGTFGLALLSETIPRFVWMLEGWGCRSANFILEDPVAARAELDLFREDCDIFHRLENHPDKEIPTVGILIQRSTWQLVHIQQMEYGFEDNNWDLTVPASKFIENKHKKILQEQAAEDAFNVCRTVEALGWNKGPP